MSHPTPTRQPFWVRSSEVADVLTNVQDFRIVLQFMHPEGSTVSALAEEHQITLNAAYRKVQKLCDYGLLTVLREEQRSGRSVKVYGCSYQSFFIPNTLFSLEEQLTHTFEPYRKLIQQNMALAALHESNPVGGLIMKVAAGSLWLVPATAQGERWTPELPGTPAFLHSSGPLYLDPAEAKALEAELYAVFDRYRQRSGAGTYLLHMILAPVAEVTSGLPWPHSGHTELV